MMVVTDAFQIRMSEGMDLYTDFADGHRLQKTRDRCRNLLLICENLCGESVRSVYRHS